MKFIKTTICLTLLLALSACSEKQTADSYLDKAKNYSYENKVYESIIELKNAIRLDNKHAEARFLLGRAYLNLGDGVAAVKELERAKSFHYPANKVIPLLARAYILTESDADIIALSDQATTLANDEQSHFLAYKTLAAIRSDNIELARASATLAESLTNKSLYSMLASAYVQLADNKNEQANTTVTRILSIDEENPDALMLQGQVAMLMKNYTQASTSFKHYLKVQPNSASVQLLLADALLRNQKYQEAEKYAATILAIVPNQPFAHYIKAMVYFNDKDFTNASHHAETAIVNGFKSFNLQLLAGASAFYLKKWEQSYNHLSGIITSVPNDHQARKMLAVSQLELGLVDEISTTLQGVEAGNDANAPFLTSLSFKLLELGATDKAKQLLAKSAKFPSSDAKQNARQGVLKLMLNDPSGIQDLKDAIELNPELTEAELALAFAALKTNDTAQALKIAEKWQKKYPEKAGGLNLMASVHIHQQEYSQAEELLKQSLTLEANNIFALTEQLKIAQLQKNEVLSKKRVDHLISVFPHNTQALRSYFSLYRNEEALHKIATSFEQDNKNLPKALLFAEALFSLKQSNKAITTLMSFENNNTLPKKYWQLLTLIYRQQQQINNLVLTLEKWRKKSPYHLEPVILLADIYAAQKNYAKALKMVNNTFQYHPDNSMLHLVKMQLLLNTNQIEQAKTVYRKLAHSEISDTLKQGLLGRLLLLEEKYPQAVSKLEGFYKAYPSKQNARYLSLAYLRNKENDKAVKLFENFLTVNPEDTDIKIDLAGVYLANDVAKAVEIYGDVIKKQPNNIVVNNNLAWLYLERGDVEKAFSHAKLAYELAPQNVNVIDTYAKVLLKKGNHVDALEHASRANKLAKGTKIDIVFNYIEALIANKRLNEARKLLEKTTPKSSEHTARKAKLLNEIN